ncbi:MAG TPA: EamA family transporter [Gammaproteobacteria bacterium]|nr:EamA family transporter [Gammaproteobacteria bacterium]
MSTLLLVSVVTALYACYNLFIKVSSDYVPVNVTSTVLATICLQLAALTATLCFLSFLVARGGQILALSSRAYLWAAGAGLCIGVAEICYFYLFRGGEGREAAAANVAIPIIVSGTIAITLIASYFLFREPLTPLQLGGTLLVISGMILIALGATG